MRDRYGWTGLALAAAMLGGVPALAQAPGGMPPKQVGVLEVQLQDVPRVITLPGRAVAAAAAGIRPRVGGIVTEILYQPGRPIEAGDPMFRIEATTYEANLASAEANLTSARAQLTQAEAAFRRTEQLLGSGTTQAQVEAARATFDQAQASVEAADAARRLAEADLDWTTVTSPISGIASVAEVSVGDLVTAGQAADLARVTQLDPIEVDMYEPASRFLAVLDDINAGRLELNDELRATLTLENGQTYEGAGELIAPGVTVSTTTGSIDSRFRFSNSDGLILPGMFLRGRVEMGRSSAFLVSQSAAIRDKIGNLSAWVVVDGKASLRELKEDGSYQNQWIVTDGLAEGDMLVVDGLAGLVEGMDVVSVPVTFDENGVVRDLPPAEAPADGAPAPADGAAAPAEAPAETGAEAPAETPAQDPTQDPTQAPAE